MSGPVVALASKVGRVAREMSVDDTAVRVFEGMLAGWRDCQLARNLRIDGIDARERLVRRVVQETATWPWAWTVAQAERWVARLRVGGAAQSTVRRYENDLRSFTAYAADPCSEWMSVCQACFGSAPPVLFADPARSARHAQETEGEPHKRALTQGELQDLFDYGDEQVVRARLAGPHVWLPAFRDVTCLKVAYSFGLRRREICGLRVSDFGRNPQAAEFGRFGVCEVRLGKASRGSAPKPRTVLTVFDWTPAVLAEYLEDVRMQFKRIPIGAMWPTTHGTCLSPFSLYTRLADYVRVLGLSGQVDLHSLRRSYVSHLIEGGWDPLFVQQQVGHAYASTTALYTFVSNDYRTRVLRATLDATIARAVDSRQ